MARIPRQRWAVMVLKDEERMIMEEEPMWVLVFDSTNAAMAAQTVLAGLNPFVIPTPRGITASCSISLRMPEQVAIKAREILADHPEITELSSWHKQEGEGYQVVEPGAMGPRLTGDENPADPIASVEVTAMTAEGGCETRDMTVQAEHSLDVFVNEELTMRVVCTPTHLFDLIIGRLLTEGLVCGIEEIASIDLLANGTRANVYLHDRQADFSHAHVNVVPTCCTGNQLFNSYFANDDRMQKLAPVAWDPDWVFRLAGLLAIDTPLHRQTFGAHSCYLAHKDKLICCREDLGRHNALDKAVGAALRAGVNLEECVIYSSGRVPVDMVQKVIRARIPVLASKAVPTDMTIRLAREFNLTLICSARPDSMKVLNAPIEAC